MSELIQPPERIWVDRWKDGERRDFDSFQDEISLKVLEFIFICYLLCGPSLTLTYGIQFRTVFSLWPNLTWCRVFEEEERTCSSLSGYYGTSMVPYRFRVCPNILTMSFKRDKNFLAKSSCLNNLVRVRDRNTSTPGELTSSCVRLMSG